MYRLIFLVFISSLSASASKAASLYNGLDPLSVRQHLALYTLFPDTEAGKQALKEAGALLHGAPEVLPQVELVNLLSVTDSSCPQFTAEDLAYIEHLAKGLQNRKLPGFKASRLDDLYKLSSEDVDLGRGLLLSQLADLDAVRRYEAMLDLMALQIQARIKDDEQIIQEINRFVFHELRFRFPPESSFSDDIDVYTFLPSVLDGRRGVCLGVSALYMVLAERLGLDVEAVTPPGHIFLRVKDRNIETTARGVHVESDDYLSLGVRFLQKRTKKELIGLSKMNEASSFLQEGNFNAALKSYKEAEKTLGEDALLQELMGYSLLLTGSEREAFKVLEKVSIPEHLANPSLSLQEVLSRNLDSEALSILFKKYEDTRQGLLEREKDLNIALKRLPNSQTLHFHKGITELSLGKRASAQKSLEGIEDLQALNILVHLSLKEENYPKAWENFLKLKELCKAYSYEPKELATLQSKLYLDCPLAVEGEDIKGVESH